MKNAIQLSLFEEIKPKHKEPEFKFVESTWNENIFYLVNKDEMNCGGPIKAEYTEHGEQWFPGCGCLVNHCYYKNAQHRCPNYKEFTND